MKASSKALQNIAAGNHLSSGTWGSSAMSNAANAGGTDIPAKPVQASEKPWGPPLAIEDAKERDKLLCKAEEAKKWFLYPVIETEQSRCPVACHYLGLNPHGQSGKDGHCREGAGVTAQTYFHPWRLARPKQVHWYQ